MSDHDHDHDTKLRMRAKITKHRVGNHIVRVVEGVPLPPGKHLVWGLGPNGQLCLIEMDDDPKEA